MSPAFYRYIEKHCLYQPLIPEQPAKGLKTIVIIPAYNEPELLHTLNSLKDCHPTQFPAEVLVLINHSNETSDEIKKQNLETYQEIKQWATQNKAPRLTFYAALVTDLPPKKAGAGLARKIAMDEAIRRFLASDETQGTIASLDADTLVSRNYLAEIEKQFASNTRLNAVTFSFEHPINANNPGQEAPEPMVSYELYLRYYKQALASTGFPFAFYTIGSCFAVRAATYIKQGGMNRKQAGEDFYFLNKVFPLGNCQELNQITVYPSSRFSNRVPFGTGPALLKIQEQGDLLTYHPSYFEDLKSFFQLIPEFYHAQSETYEQVYKQLPATIEEFLPYDAFSKNISEIKQNTASLTAFTNRFFRWFDAFQVIKFLNYHHRNDENKIPITEACKLFFKQIPENPREMLEYLRNLKK